MSTTPETLEQTPPAPAAPGTRGAKPLRRSRKNQAEEACIQLLESRGWRLSARGWPDLCAWKDGQFIVVTVRGKRGRRLKKHQKRVNYSLAKRGIEAFVYDAEGGFEKLGPQSPHLD